MNTLVIFGSTVVAVEGSGTRELSEASFEEAAATSLDLNHMPYCAVDDGDMTEEMARNLAADGGVNKPGLCWKHDLNLTGFVESVRILSAPTEAPASTRTADRR